MLEPVRTDAAPSARLTRALLAGCFFVSGGAGLVYEVLWSRHLHLLFGSTTESVAVVLATFMAGLGLGAHLLGGVVDRSRSPMRLYGLLEAGVGLYAFATGPLIALARAAYAACAHHLPPGSQLATIVKLILAAVVLLPPATLMGGTLPALARATSESGERARRQVGLLYALNTLGAVFGTLLTGFVLVETLGLATSMQLTAIVNLGVGLLVIARSRRIPEAAPATEPAATGSDGALSTAALKYAFAGLSVAGATTMLYEVVFTRVLGLVFGVSSYAFTIVLAVFLAGLALGALAAHALARRRAPRPWDFALSQLALGLLAVATAAAVPSVPRLVMIARQVPELGFWAVLEVKAAIAVALLLPLAFAAGLGTPLLLAALAGDLARLGRRVGDAYMVNTAGTIAGSLATGFVLVARLGTQGSLRAAALANLALGAAGALALPSRNRRSRALALGLAALGAIGAIGSARWPIATFLLSDTHAHPRVSTTRLAFETKLSSGPRELDFFAEGREGTVAVVAAREARSLLVNGHPDASDREDMATQLMLGFVPLAALRRPEDVLVIGFGSGVTAATALRVPEVRAVDVVELERAVLDAAPWFHHVNRAAERDPRLRAIHDDARSFVAATDRAYDAIVSEPSNPWRAGVATLFTAEFYASARARLKPGGVFAQWVQLYALGDGTLKMILHTLAESFPELQVWWLDPGNVVVLGSTEPLALDPARIARLLAGPLGADVERYAHVARPDELYARFLLDGAGVRRFVGEQGALAANTDDQPFLEFEAPRGLFEADGQNNLRLLAAKLAGAATAPLPSLPPLLAGGDAPAPDLLWAGVAWMYQAAERPLDARAAAERALLHRPGPFVLARLADVALLGGDLNRADALVAAAARASPANADAAAAPYLATVTARLRIKEHRAAEALAACDAAGGLDGKLGVERLTVLAGVGRAEEAYAQAARSLSNARLGSEVESQEVGAIYDALLGLARGGGDPQRIAKIIEDHPGDGFPAYPRERTLAFLSGYAKRPAEALAHARAALAVGAFDAEMLEVAARALVELGRADEARALEEKLKWLAPSSLRERVPSPLLEGRAPPAPPAPVEEPPSQP